MSELNYPLLIEQLELSAQQHVVLALSGGLDSMVLLDLLAKASSELPFSLQAVYVHHGISQYADVWGQFCQQQCQARNIEFVQRKVVLAGKDNLEAKARDARYQVLQEYVTSEQHLLLTAHHGGDQLENLLLALKRGAGLTGIAGMKPVRSFARGYLKRPLLGFSRQQLEQYAAAVGLKWIEDDSNSDERFDRNFIRQNVTPKLLERWPQFVSTLHRSTQMLQQTEQLLLQYSEQDFQRCSLVDGSFDLQQLSSFDQSRQNYLLRRWLNQWQLNPSLHWLTTLREQVIHARQDACPILQLQSYQLRRFANRLYVLADEPLLMPTESLHWQGQAVLALPESLGQITFSTAERSGALPLASSAAEVVFGQLNLRFKPAGAAHSKPLKQWFKLWQVAPWQRQRIPLLLCDGELKLVPGYASADQPADACCWVHWQR